MTDPTAQTPELEITAFKFNLDPNTHQLSAMRQWVGAARVGYNMLFFAKMNAHDAYAQRIAEHIEQGLDYAAAKKIEQQRMKSDPSLKIPNSMDFGPTLTAAIARHRQAAQRIADGEDPELIWDPEAERYSNPWMHAVPRRALISGMRNMDVAYSNWISSRQGKRKGPKIQRPRPKRAKDRHDSVTIPAETTGAKGSRYLKKVDGRAGEILDHRHLRLGPLGVVRTHDTTKPLTRHLEQHPEARITSFTLSRNADRWYVSVLVQALPESVQTTKKQRRNGPVGVDLGVKSLAVLSTGEVFENPRHIKHAERQIKRLQQALSRTEKGSNRRTRAIRKLAAAQHKLALRRETSLHELSKRLTTEHDLVVLEDLNVSGMTRSAKGTIEKPGNNVRAKAGLNRAILDASPGTLRSQITYKARRYGAEVVTIDRFAPSSKMCSACGAIKPILKLSERTYHCEHCDLTIDRDLNAAINIRELGLINQRENTTT